MIVSLTAVRRTCRTIGRSLINDRGSTGRVCGHAIRVQLVKVTPTTGRLVHISGGRLFVVDVVVHFLGAFRHHLQPGCLVRLHEEGDVEQDEEENGEQKNQTEMGGVVVLVQQHDDDRVVFDVGFRRGRKENRLQDVAIVQFHHFGGSFSPIEGKFGIPLFVEGNGIFYLKGLIFTLFFIILSKKERK